MINFAALLKSFRIIKVLAILFGVFTISIYACGSLASLQDKNNWFNLICGLISLFFLVSAGYLMNNYCDLKYDSANNPSDTAISKLIEPKTIRIIFIIFFIIGPIVALLVGIWFFLIIMADLIVLVFYNIFSKKLSYLKDIIIALLVISIYPLSFAITSGGMLSLRRDSLFIFPAWLFLMILAYELVEDILDIKGDQAGGGSTIPIKIGAKKTRTLAVIAALVSVPIAFIPFYYGMCGKSYFAGALISLPLLIGSMFLSDSVFSKGMLFYVMAITASSFFDIIFTG